MLKRCEEALDSQDLFTIQHCVDRLSHWLAEADAPDDVREAFFSLLEAKAGESDNRVIAVYLRSVVQNCRNHGADRSQ